MGSAERRERERQQVRERILDAARELFVAQGYDAVTMRGIAERIEYSAPAIYFHFEDKLAVVRALCEADFLALAESFGTIARVADPVERIRAAGKAYVEFGLTHPHHYRLMFMTQLPAIPTEDSGLEHGNPEQDAYAFLRLAVADAIAAGRFRPEFADPETVAQMLWAVVHGVVALHIAKGSDAWIDWRPARETAALAIAAALRGIVRDNRSGN